MVLSDATNLPFSGCRSEFSEFCIFLFIGENVFVWFRNSFATLTAVCTLNSSSSPVHTVSSTWKLSISTYHGCSVDFLFSLADQLSLSSLYGWQMSNSCSFKGKFRCGLLLADKCIYVRWSPKREHFLGEWWWRGIVTGQYLYLAGLICQPICQYLFLQNADNSANLSCSWDLNLRTLCPVKFRVWQTWILSSASWKPCVDVRRLRSDGFSCQQALRWKRWTDSIS